MHNEASCGFGVFGFGGSDKRDEAGQKVACYALVGGGFGGMEEEGADAASGYFRGLS